MLLLPTETAHPFDFYFKVFYQKEKMQHCTLHVLLNINI